MPKLSSVYSELQEYSVFDHLNIKARDAEDFIPRSRVFVFIL
jgi:hypothetical protein